MGEKDWSFFRFGADYYPEHWPRDRWARDAEIMANYSSGMYAGKPAIALNRFGKGVAVYVGTFASAEFYDELVSWLLRKGIIERVLPSIGGLEVTRRKGGEKEIIFLLNHGDETAELDLRPRTFEDLLSGETLRDHVKIGGLDFRVIIPD